MSAIGIGVAEPRVELDAVDHDPVVGRMPVREPVDVVEAEVAVRVAGDAAAGAILDDVAGVGPGRLRSGLAADRRSTG